MKDKLNKSRQLEESSVVAEVDVHSQTSAGTGVTCIDFYSPMAPAQEQPAVELPADATAKDDSSGIGNVLGYRFEPPLKGSDVRTKILEPNSQRRSYGTSGSPSGDYISVADIIGDFGWFQFLVLLFSGLREASVGYDAVVMSIITQPETEFLCADRFEGIKANYHTVLNLTQNLNDTVQCYHTINGQMVTDELNRPIRCTSWVFEQEPDKLASLVAEWSLVCHRHWLVAFVESAYFFGLVTGNLVWGYYADKVGRRRAYLLAHLVSLVAGWSSVLMPNIQLFAIARFFSAFGSIGYNIIYSIQVELIGKKHRSFSTILNHLGWGMGVISVPIVDHLFHNYRYIIMVTPMMTLLMFPWAFWIPESSRWLMSNDDFPAAKRELIRAARFNGKTINAAVKKKISMLKQSIKADKMRQEAASNQHIDKQQPYSLLFSNPILVRDTLVLAYISFTGHLFYYMLTINFGYMKNLSTDANFIISGAGEWVSVVIGAILLKLYSRKTCMTLFLTLMCGSFLFQSLIDSDLAPSLDTQAYITTNNGVGTLSALLLVFVTLIVNQEVYPTVIRQTGSSIVNTIGESGSTLAPLLIQLGHRWIGMWRMDVAYSFVCAIGIIGVQFITKTDDIELPDN